MHTLEFRVNFSTESPGTYKITIGENLFPKIANYLHIENLGSRYAIITDSNVADLYAPNLEECLRRKQLQVETFTFPAGEQNKRISVCENITDKMSARGFGRDSVIIALGGGVVGDMAGFIASVFNRGVPYVQVPTTVLSQADSSVGGKTGVDTNYGKNLWGVIKQPSAVFIDISTLRTLPDKEIRNGLAETIKHGIIADSTFFEYLEAGGIDRVLQKDVSALSHIAERNCKIKSLVVQADPNEKGLRRILNYGHTVGHAVETLSNFTISHGFAISMGMMVGGRISRELGYFSDSDISRQEEVLTCAGLPVRIPQEITDEAIFNKILIDKKAANGQARFCLPKWIGEMHEFNGVYATPVSEKIVQKALDETR